MALIMNGKVVASAAEEKLKLEVEELKIRLGFTPALATILVGDDMASVTYVNMKAKACERVGLRSQIIRLDETITTEDLLAVIDELNNNTEICGILLQHPVPKHIDERACFDRIAIEKDVDGVNSASFGRMSMDKDAYIFNVESERKTDVRRGVFNAVSNANMAIIELKPVGRTLEEIFIDIVSNEQSSEEQ